MLLMLEDCHERVARFTTVLQAIAPDLPFCIWRDAHVMVREVTPYLTAARLISLDHDLDPEHPDSPDPGDGLAVVKFLVTQPIVRPVILHTSNRERAVWMEGDFELAGWPTYRVAPLGDDWIELDWRRMVRRLLRRPPKQSEIPQ